MIFIYIFFFSWEQNFYVIGRDKNRTCWRVLKIDRLDPTDLNILEDSTIYSEIECCDLLKRIHEGNKPTGGLKFVTTCYGIVGMLSARFSTYTKSYIFVFGIHVFFF